MSSRKSLLFMSVSSEMRSSQNLMDSYTKMLRESSEDYFRVPKGDLYIAWLRTRAEAAMREGL